ncbi:zinc-binding dehydrogenase [Candidatus Poribacteria bacterium]|nr:zinc-binding dehydrogenase [Candidatus Poribacteria bacterium]
MQKAVILGERQAGLVDVPDPKAKDDWVVVKVHAAPMCTEYKGWLGGGTSDFMGHEAAGEVVEVAQPGKVRVGDRVVVMPQTPCGTCELCVAGDYIHCERPINFREFHGTPEGNATMAQYLLKPSWLLPKVPDGVSYERAGLACCALGPSMGAFETMGVGRFSTVLITGLGPVGLGAVVNARFRGARVFAVDSVRFRADRALAMGAERVFDPNEEDIPRQLRELTGGKGVDASLDCSGNIQAERLGIDATRRKGKVAYVGESGADLAIRVSPDMIRKGLTIMGSWHYNLNLFPKIMQVIQESDLLDLLVTHVLPMRDIQRAMELCASHDTGKVILQPWA